jgi:POT family proton-dependent oligopeptide transporter
LVLGLVALSMVIALFLTGTIRVNPVSLARNAAGVIVAVAVLYFGGVYAFGNLDKSERRRVHVIVILFLSSALFWAGFEQAGSSFNLFAERFTERALGSFIIPAGWYQSLGPVFVIVFAPVFAALWVWLAGFGREPSLSVKFGLGLILLGVGFAVMAGASAFLSDGSKVSPTWLITTYLLHTFGELCLSPVGLSSVTKLAPQRYVGQMMGTWFLGSSLGNLIAGLLAGRIRMDGTHPVPGDFLAMLWMPLAAGLVLVLAAPIVRRWSGGVR